MAIGSVAGVTAPAAGVLGDQYPSNPLADTVDLTTSVRTAITATGNATPFNDGTYVEIDPSLSADASGVFVMIPLASQTTGANTSTVLEIGTGAGGAEAAWGAVQVGFRLATEGYFVPGFIAAGTRVAVRVRSAVISKVVVAHYTFLAADKGVDPAVPAIMGYTAGAAAGVVLTTPGGANAKGAWTEIIASTAATYSLLLVNIGGGRTSTQTGGSVLVDIGTGPNPSETAIISNIYFDMTSNEQNQARAPQTFGILATIPSGTRLSARFQATNAGADVDVFLVGA